MEDQRSGRSWTEPLTAKMPQPVRDVGRETREHLVVLQTVGVAVGAVDRNNDLVVHGGLMGWVG